MKINYHFNEPQTLKTLQDYIDSTYSAHYVGDDDVQAFDLIAATGHGEGFCIGNIIKLGSRYGKKAGRNETDILKILHYGVMLLNIHNKNNNKKVNNERTDTRTTSTKPTTS